LLVRSIESVAAKAGFEYGVVDSKQRTLRAVVISLGPDRCFAPGRNCRGHAPVEYQFSASQIGVRQHDGKEMSCGAVSGWASSNESSLKA